MLNTDTGDLIPSRCDAQKCPYCIRRHVREMPQLIAAGQPERSLTITQLPDEWQKARAQVRDLFRRLRDRGYSIEAAWTTERTKAGVRHLHAATHGDYLPQEEVQAMVGGRFVWLNRIDGSGESWGQYLGKMAEGQTWANYLSKGATEHVADNGGRILHATRGYFRGETMTEIRAKLRNQEGGEGDTWQLVSIAELSDQQQMRLRQSGRLAAIRETLDDQPAAATPGEATSSSAAPARSSTSSSQKAMI